MNKQVRRRKIRYRVRNKVTGTGARPRLSVFRSNKAIYCQLIDDTNGVTLASASSTDMEHAKDANKAVQAKAVGALIADKAKDLNISEIVFDRGGYLFHGRVKALAEGAREKGLKF